jgi:BirA family biotin operon repressor/biotin-[acetyl-CoA-carboxylase] ligase
MPDCVDPAAVEAALAPPVRGPVVWAASVTSTNDLVAARARAGAPEGLVIGADHQSAGRGRRGRVWEDRPGDAVLMSVLLRPPVAPAAAGLLPVVAAVGLAEGLAALGVPVRVSWPNDLLVPGGKAGGILCELSADATRVSWAVVGVGVNVAAAPGVATGRWAPASLAAALGGAAPARQDVAAAMLRGLGAWCARWYADGAAPVLDAFAGRDALAGRRVRLRGPDGETAGVAAGLSPDGGLRLRGDDGVVTVLGAGEVTGVTPAD